MSQYNCSAGPRFGIDFAMPRSVRNLKGKSLRTEGIEKQPRNEDGTLVALTRLASVNKGHPPPTAHRTAWW